MEIVGFIMALVIGVSLGLIGGGGSILAVPVLAYMFGLDEKIATAYSLFIVGTGALVGGLKHSQNKNVDWRTAMVFGLPAVVGVWIIRHFVVPALPDTLFTVSDFSFTRRMGMFGLLAILMLASAYSMLKDKKIEEGRIGNVIYNYPLILIEGIIVGAITGFVGAGGGFLIIPALMLLTNLDIKKVIGTSLIIIAFKSLLGFLLGDSLILFIDWQFLMVFSIITLVGIFLGLYLGKFIDGKKLKKGFGYFILMMVLFIFIMEFLIKN
jgi:uncharacterized membrane protein YfcA